MAFFSGQIPSAAEMNALLQAADSAHLGAAGFLAADNGFEQVVRNPRRQIVRGAAAVPAAACQWRVEAARIPEDEGGGLSITCGAGIVEWGGWIWATPAGSVQSIKIGTKTDFDADELHYFDDEVVIVVNTYKDGFEEITEVKK